jgi:hypothetical protein
MAEPDTLNWINQSVNEVAKVLRASTDFMSASSLANGNGIVTRVDEHEIDQSLLNRTGVIVASCRYDSHYRATDDDAAHQQDYLVDIAIRIMGKLALNHRPADRIGVIRSIQRAASVISHIVYTEIGPAGGQFAGFSELAFPIDGNILDVQDENGYYIVLDTGIRLQVTLYD